MKKSLVIILVVMASVVNAQITWLKSFDNSVTAYETSDAVNFVEFLKDGSTWKIKIMNESLSVSKTTTIQSDVTDWTITDNFEFVAVNNVFYNVFKPNKMAFEITFYIASNAANRQYYTYMFDEDGTMLNLNFGFQGNVVGNYIIHETLDNLYTVSSIPGTPSKIITTKASNVKAFPNPTTQTVNLTQSGSVINVYNLSGQLIENLPAGTRTIDVANYVPGHYIIRVDDATLQFIKN